MYIFELKTVATEWASTNEIPILYMEEYFDHDNHGTLPKEFFIKELGGLMHHITPFYSFEGNTILTEKDRHNITNIVGLYEIQGIGLDEPPKVTPYLDFLRDGGASMHKNLHKLHHMIETLYDHFAYWALVTNAENWSMKDNVKVWRKDVKRAAVERALTWMREVYFKKDWRATEGPLPEYIV
jgi:hypothetical protein